jgi:hypothetical protein
LPCNSAPIQTRLTEPPNKLQVYAFDSWSTHFLPQAQEAAHRPQRHFEEQEDVVATIISQTVAFRLLYLPVFADTLIPISKGIDWVLLCPCHLEGRRQGKFLSPSKRRRVVDHVCRELGVSERRACRVVGQASATQRRPDQVTDGELKPWLRS